MTPARQEPNTNDVSLRVALINMPWARIDAPSIQCGLLKAIAVEAGHRCDVHYPNIDLAASLGGKLYETIADIRGERLHLLGEWLFAFAAFGEVLPEPAYFADYPELEPLWAKLTGCDLSHLVELRREVLPAWLEKEVEQVNWGEYDVVGFSSTFLQNTASLSFGRLVKSRFPLVRLVYGGANFNSEMGPEYARHLPWLDYVVAGEGDAAFPALLDAIATECPATSIPGVHSHAAGDNPMAAPAESMPVRDLDSLPMPDYREYFATLDRYDHRSLFENKRTTLLVEFSRGCWWGEKHHCTFCGLNSAGMVFRAKSAGRAMDELTTMLREYPAVRIEAVDNIIDMKYLSSLCDQLGRQHWDVDLFFEVKANLNREQLSTMRRAGIRRIQPGIESLSSHVLRLMDKGANKLTNVRLLKWARYYGLTVMWNILTGLPGERDADYEEQADTIPSLYHLEPPSMCGRIWLERFSPYFTTPSYPIFNVRPSNGYRHVYPADLDHSKIAYFFDYEVSDVSSDGVRAQLGARVKEWQQRWNSKRRPNLVYRKLPGRLTIVDRRLAQARSATLRTWQARAYEACGDAARSVAGVRRDLVTEGYEVSTPVVRRFLTKCCTDRIMIEDDGHYLSLALPDNPGW